MKRKKKKQPKAQVTIQLDQEALETIDKLAEKVQLSRSQLCSNLIIMGLDDAKLLNSIGLTSIAIFIRSLLERISPNDLGKVE